MSLRQNAPLFTFLLAAGVALGAEGPPVPAVNKDFTIEDCGTPVQVMRLVASTLYKHPGTGRLHLFLEYGNNNGYGIGEQEWEDTGHRLIDVELESGTIRRAKGAKPGGLTGQHFLHPNGKLYIFEGKTNPDSFSEYDPRTNECRRVAGIGPAYKTVLAPSGRIYIGEVGGNVSVYDPQVGKLTRYDRPTGRTIHWGVYTMEVEEPWVYCGMTDHGHWWLTVIDTRTGESKSYFEQPPLTSGSVVRTEAGNILFRDGLLKDGKPVLDADGKPARPDPPDKSKRLEGNRPWPNMWRVTGYANSKYPEPEEGLGLEFDMADAEPSNWNGGVGTVRWRKKGEEAWKTIEVKGLELIGSSPKCLGVAPDGKLVGVAEFYGAFFRFDPRTGTSEKIGIAPGSVYDILPLADHTYFCGYVSFLADYDHGQPYAMSRSAEFDKDTNPKRYRTEGKWTTCMVRGPDGRIYLGGKYGRHLPGGGLSIFDPKTKEMRRIREPFKQLGVVGLYVIDGGNTLALTTKPVGAGGPPHGSIFLFDLAKQEIAREVKLDQLKANPDQLLVVGDRAVIGVSRASEPDEFGHEKHFTLVYGLDLESGALLFQKRHPGRAFTGMCAYDHTDLVRGPDACGWLFVDEALCRIHPDGSLERVRERMDFRGKMVWQGNTLYLFNGGRVYNRLFANVVRIPDLFAK
ncbi:MAG TPA: hypothetical protein VNE39_15790 [Planctomycetota bacterium]|nr:hypothetical protein [Planctomycetota bacterium]